MLLLRWAVLMLLLASAVCFGFYVGTGQERYRQLGWKILKGTLVAAFAFFAVLIAERMV